MSHTKCAKLPQEDTHTSQRSQCNIGQKKASCGFFVGMLCWLPWRDEYPLQVSLLRALASPFWHALGFILTTGPTADTPPGAFAPRATRVGETDTHSNRAHDVAPAILHEEAPRNMPSLMHVLWVLFPLATLHAEHLDQIQRRRTCDKTFAP